MPGIGEAIGGIFGMKEEVGGYRDAGRLQQHMMEEAMTKIAQGQDASRSYLNQLMQLSGPLSDISGGYLGGNRPMNIADLLFQNATASGLSPLAQLQLKTSEEAINRGLSRMGIGKSGAGLEELTKSAERISAADTAEKYNRLLQLSNIQQGLAGTLDERQQAALRDLANLSFKGGQAQSNILSGFAPGAVDLSLGASKAGAAQYSQWGKAADIAGRAIINSL